MHPVSQLKLFIAHAAVGILALATPAGAATVFVNLNATINSDVTGDAGAAGAPDNQGVFGGAGVEWIATLVDVIVNAGVTITGGVGGDGGVDFANNGGNTGGTGGHALNIDWDSGTATTNNGVKLTGGLGGAGSNGGTGGAGDAAGGFGGLGGYGILLGASGDQVTLTGTTVKGGAGGGGGSAGDAAGDATNAANGGNGGFGGAGIAVDGAANATINLVNTTVTGGAGGEGGVSLASATNANGGGGGAGIGTTPGSTNTIITIDPTSVVAGGVGGSAGAGGTGGAAGGYGAAIYLQGLGASITNHGSIVGGNVYTDGPGVLVAGNTTSIENFGQITAVDTSAVVLSGGDLSVLHNRAGATISVTGGGAGVYVNSGTLSNFINEGSILNSIGSAVRVDGAIGSFVNSGLIEGANSAALGFSGAGAPDLIDNSGGIISNNSVVNPTIGFVQDVGASGITLNGGQIVSNGSSAAIEFFSAQTGSITVKNADISGRIKFDAADETLNVISTTLAGGVEFTGGNNNLNFEAGGATIIAAGSSFTNVTFFSLLAGADVAVNTEQNDANSSITKLTTIVSSTLLLNEDFWVDDAVLNQGSIEIATSKTLTANGFVGDGVYVFNVTDALIAGKIEAQGAFSEIDLTGASIEVKLTNPSAMFAAGTNFLLGQDLNGNDILGVTNGALATDNSALLTFRLYRGDAAEIALTSDLLFAQVQAALLADIAGEGDDPNSIALGAALDEIGLDGDADLDDLMLDLALLGTNKEINDALDALLPETDGVAYDLATDAGDQMLDVASRRLDGLRGSASASLEYRVASLSLLGLRGTAAPAARSQLWGQAFGRTVDQSKHSYNDGYDAGSYGFAVGADTALDNATQLGAAFSYTSTDADGNGINRTDTEVDSYQLTLYGDHLFDNRMYAKGLLAYGWHQNDIARHDVGGIPGNTATGGYDASQVNLRAELGRSYAGGGNLSLIPRATLNAAWYSPDGYSEQGVGGLGLTVLPDDLTSVRLGLGLLARWDVNLTGGELFQPELRLDYRRDLTRERFETTSEFLGAPGIAFVTQGVEPPADILNLGVGALLATAGGVDLRASYDLELKEDYTAHAGYIRASIPF